MSSQSRWTYTFTDLLTGVEKATLPMVGVSFEQKLCDVGQFEGIIPTTDPNVRALDPWAASDRRRSGLFVERDDVPVWGGIVQSVTRDQGTYGLKVTAATFETWLAQAYQRADVNLVGAQLGAPSTVKVLVGNAQNQPNGKINLGVSSTQWPGGVGGDGTGENRVAGQVYAATDLKTLTDVLTGWVTRWGTPIEWRIDVTRNTGGLDQYGSATTAAYTITLLVTEGTFAEGRDRLALFYPGNALTFSDAQDGTTEANVVLGAASGPNDAGGNPTKLLSVSTADQVGSDEFIAGYPVKATTYSVGGTNIAQATLDGWTQRTLLDRLVQGQALSNLTVLADNPGLSSYAVGDAVDLEIVHPGYREWPQAIKYGGYRIIGRKVTVGSGSTPDTVALDVVPPADRLPKSLAFTATVQDILNRLKGLEVRSTG